MHELSIASAILDQLTAERERRPGARITAVGVRVGTLSGVDPDALTFGFSVLVKDTAWDPLALHIERVERRQKCPACQTIFSLPPTSKISFIIFRALSKPLY